MYDINKLREDFPILKKNNLVYLDNASTTQKPNIVIKTINDFYKNFNANVHRGNYDIAEKATAKYENTRKETAKLLNCSSNEIIFTKGTTESINLVASSLADSLLRTGDEVIISEMEHHSNIIPWQLLVDKKKINLKYIPISKKGTLKIEELSRLITKKTRLISITHMSNLLGVINPIEDIISIAKNNNILTLIDAAQSISHLEIDVRSLDCDFLVFSGHKFFGPTGVGVLYGKYDLLEKMPPFLGGGHMIKEVSMTKSTWGDPPFKFEAGTPNIAPVIGLGEAIKYYNKIHNKELYQYLNTLTNYMIGKLITIPNIQIYPLVEYHNKSKGPIIAFKIKDVHPFDLAKLLGTKGICIRAGHHCTQPILKKFNVTSLNRVSLYYYNTKEEIDLFYKSILDIIKILI